MNRRGPPKRLCKPTLHFEHSQNYNPNGQEFPYYLLVGVDVLMDGIYEDRYEILDGFRV